MKLFFFRGYQRNFGDELNLWLMPKIFGDFFDDDEKHLFLGIGSVIYDHHPAASEKIVFGTGYGGYTPPPSIDDSWTIFSVRGPLTAKALGLGPEKVAGDSAILINRHYSLDSTKSVRASFIPHWESLRRGNWQEVCDLAGIKFIDPRADVDTVLERIQESDVVLTEAMHGAIVSDALRVPWIAIQPFDRAHHMKWQDWASSLDMVLHFSHAAPSSEAELKLQHRGGHLQYSPLDDPSAWIERASASLAELSEAEPMLSNDASLELVLSRLESDAEQILERYGHA